jgi:hypothetical protein
VARATVTIDGQPLTYSLMVDPDNNLIDTPATVAGRHLDDGGC